MPDFMQNKPVDFLKIILDTTALLESTPQAKLFLPNPAAAEIAMLKTYTIIDNERQRRTENNTLTQEESDAIQKLVPLLSRLYKKAIKFKSVDRQFRGIELGLVQ